MDLPVKPLSDFRDDIAKVLNRTAIEIGTILIEAKYAHPRRFEAWVEEELPFSAAKAHQLMAISRAFRELPPEKREALPAPWTTLFRLTRLGRPELESAIEAGIITPETTGAQALALTGRDPAPAPKARGWRTGPPSGAVKNPRLPLPLLVREILRYDPSDLPPASRQALATWLRGDEHGERELDGAGQLRRA